MPPTPIPDQFDPYKQQQQMLANLLRQQQPAQQAQEPIPAPPPVGGEAMSPGRTTQDFLNEWEAQKPAQQPNPLESLAGGINKAMATKRQMDAINPAPSAAPAAGGSPAAGAGGGVPDLGVRGWLEKLFG